VGDAVNLAQRLQQWADAGETVVSKPTADALGDGVELQPLEPAQVKGRDATVHAYRLLGATVGR
jgi:adenylate cyclase